MRFGPLQIGRVKSLSASPEVVEAVQDRRTNFYVRLGGTNQQINAAFMRGQQASYGWMYANRPAVRTVVDYIARNVAQLGLKCYKRVDDNERERHEEHPGAETMRRPDDKTPGDQFIFRFVADYLVYDNAYIVKFRPDTGDKLTLVRLPPAQVTVTGGRFTPDFYRVFRVDGTYFDVPPEDMIHWHGYNPDDPLLGVSKLETLRDTLQEDQVSQATTVELMKNGLKGGHIERPVEAPEWTEQGRERFQESWRNQKQNALKGDPVLEEGMKYIRDSLSPKDAELLAGRKFTVEEVCRVFGLHPGVFGLDPGGDMDELRKQVYSDVLPPITESLAGQLDQDILWAEYFARKFYFEFDLNEKLRGDPVARFAAITSATGAPWQTRNEARSLENLPPIEGGDDIITPLNVQVGSNPLPAPNVMPPQQPGGPPQDGSHREVPKATTQDQLPPPATIERKELEAAPDAAEEASPRQGRYVDEAQELLEHFYERQQRSLAKSGKFVKARWDRELTEDVYTLLASVVERESGVYEALTGKDDFDLQAVQEHLRWLAQGSAEAINGVTEKALDELGLEQALSEEARSHRASMAAARLVAVALPFARSNTVADGRIVSPRELTESTDTHEVLKDTERLERLRVLRESLGIPDEYAWQLAGFTEDEIDAMRAMQLSATLSSGSESD